MPGSDKARVKIHRFFTAVPKGQAKFALEDKSIARQIVSVLRLRPGEHIILLDGSGDEAEATILDASPEGVFVEVLERRRTVAEPYRDVTLYAAVLKREHFEYIVQKAVEVGVGRIVPVLSSRTVKQGLKIDRLMKIAQEAAEQCGRGRIPAIAEPMTFKDAIADARGNDKNIIFDIDAAPLDERAGPSKLGAFVGPEGGWTEQEVQLAAKNGFDVAGLGPLTLRGETAAVIAVYLLCRVR